jgi:arginyl-tRNA synthetase
MNYLGDWGKQYGLLALAFEMYGDEEALKANPINHLFNLYVKINSEKEAQLAEIEAAKKEGKDVSSLEAASLDEKARQYFRKMTDGDEAVLAQWQRFRDLSIARYKETYARLNINFDVFSVRVKSPKSPWPRSPSVWKRRVFPRATVVPSSWILRV